MKKSAFIFVITVMTAPLLFFQNCGDTAYQTSKPSAGQQAPRGGSNGTGYSGILKIEAPAEVNEGSRVSIRVSGGAPPYQVTVSNTSISVVDTGGGTYELVIPPDQSDYSFSVNVTDAAGDVVFANIRVLGGTDFYDVGSASAFFIDAQGAIAFDQQTQKMLYFDTEGRFQDFSLDFQVGSGPSTKYGYITALKFHQSNVYAVDYLNDSIYIFKNRFSPHRRLWEQDGGLIRPEGIALKQDRLWVTDSGDNSVLLFDLDGNLISKTLLSGLPVGSIISSIIHYPDGNIWILDRGQKKILVYSEDLELLSEKQLDFYQAESDTVYPINMILAADNSSVYLSVLEFGTKPLSLKEILYDATVNWANQVTRKLSFDDNGNHVWTLSFFKGMYWPHRPSFCLSYDHKDQLVICGNDNAPIAVNDNHDIIEVYNSSGVENAIPNPGAVVVRSDGNILANTKAYGIKFFSPDFELLNTILGVPQNVEILFVDMTTTGQTLVALGIDSRIHFYNLQTLEFQNSISLRMQDGGALYSVRAIEVHNSKIYALNEDYGVTVFDLTGTFIETLSFSDNLFENNEEGITGLIATDLGVGSTGKIFITAASKGGMYVYDSLSSQPQWYNSDTKPSAVKVIGEDTVYICERHDGRLLKFTLSDGFSVAFDQSGLSEKYFLDPAGIDIFNGHFYITDAVKNSVVVIPMNP